VIMDNGTGQLLTILPWLLAVIVPAGVGFFFIRQLYAVRLELDEAKDGNNRIQTENQVICQELVNAREILDRERKVATQRFDQLSTEKKELRSAYEQLQERNTNIQASLAAAEARLPQIGILTTEVAKLQDRHDTLRREKSTLDADFASLKTQMEEERKTSLEKIQLIEKAEQKLTKEFENLANRIFEEKQQKFSDVSKNSVETLLNPVREQLKDFRKRVDEVYDQENKERASLRTEIHFLKSLNERISTDAINLTKALKGESKTRGNWGEMQLERVLEESGLVKSREYEVQVSLKSEEGKRLQPDVVIHLPEKKEVIIDSKVSLVAYEQYHSADDDEERRRHLGKHVAALRTHFKSLSGKNYEDLIGVNSLDLVIMFVPIEPALLLAFEHEPKLFNEAFHLGILLVCPSTLMATLKIIHNIWRYEYRNRNSMQIATEAGQLHDQFVLFVEALEKIGDQIKKAGESYETAHKRLTSGKGNLVGRIHKLQVLGAKTKKNIDKALLETAAAEDNELETALLTNEQDREETTI